MAQQESVAVDPITLEVLANSLPAIANEMSYDLQRASYNMMIYEVRDYCCSLLDPQGNLIAQNLGGVSHFVADLGVVIRDGVERYGLDGIAPGDVLVTNHQRVAGQHLNNIVVYTPCFVGDELVAFAAVRAHWIDVGGMSTGFGAAALATDPWMEGLQIDQIKLYQRGVLDEQVWRLISDNIRFPESSLGDLRAQIAACRLGERRLTDLIERYGIARYRSSIEQLFSRAEARCRAVVEQIPDGIYEAEAFLDHDHVDLDTPVPIRVRVIVEGSDMTFDLTGCSPQRRGAINSRTLAGAYIAYKAITAPLDPVNEGSFRALNVVIQEGNVMMARYPAPMAGWSQLLPTVVDTILRALADALPDRVPAAHHGTLGSPLVFFGVDEGGRRFVLQSIEGAGWGGRPTEDGPSATVGVCQGDVRNAPIEAMELKCPVIIERRELREGSAGAGKYRGGFGMVTQVRSLVDGYWNLSMPGRSDCLPWGLRGGKEGAPPIHLVRKPDSEEYAPVDAARYWVPAETRVAVCTAGGGGWGDPLERDVERVAEDVWDGLVSPEAAATDYGVVIDPTTGEVDQAATARLRAERRQQGSHGPHGGDGTGGQA